MPPVLGLVPDPLPVAIQDPLGDLLAGVRGEAVKCDRAGRRIVTSPVVMGKSPDRTEAVVRGDSARRPLAIDSFRDVVKRLMAGDAAR